MTARRLRPLSDHKSILRMRADSPVCHSEGDPAGIGGEAPSTCPEVAAVQTGPGIDSVTPDSLPRAPRACSLSNNRQIARGRV